MKIPLLLLPLFAAACLSPAARPPIREPAPVPDAEAVEPVIPVAPERAHAAPDSHAAPAPTPRPLAEGRALWVTRFDYDGAARIAEIMEKARRANFNVIYFQVRGTGDAFYRSSLEPCAVALCGALGGTPPYDPLEVAVREARARGLQLHAWLNALPGFAANTAAACAMLRESTPGGPPHVLRRNPNWAMADRSGRPMRCPNGQEYVWLSPAHAEVRTQLARVAADIARRYAVDGIHLDRIRYPGAGFSYDARSLSLFGGDPDSDPAAWSEFRRSLINDMVREAHDSIAAVDPGLALSAAVWGIYEDRWRWRSSRGREQFLQDPLAWAANGYLDVAAPMTYYAIAHRYCSFADWACLLDDHIERIQEAGRRHVYIGVDARKGAAEVVRQIELGRQRGVAGFAVYSFGQVERARLWETLRDAFDSPAAVPAMPWKGSQQRAAR